MHNSSNNALSIQLIKPRTFDRIIVLPGEKYTYFDFNLGEFIDKKTPVQLALDATPQLRKSFTARTFPSTSTSTSEPLDNYTTYSVFLNTEQNKTYKELSALKLDWNGYHLSASKESQNIITDTNIWREGETVADLKNTSELKKIARQQNRTSTLSSASMILKLRPSKKKFMPITETISEHPIFLAIKNGLESKIKEFIEQGNNVNFTNCHGNTLLHAAVLDERQELVKLLIHEGANCTLKNIKGQTAIEIADQKKLNNISVLFITEVPLNISVYKPQMRSSSIVRKPSHLP